MNMINDDKMRSPFRIVATSVVFFILFFSQAFAVDIESIGRIESRVGLLPTGDDLDGNNLVHMERINWGIQQQFNLLGLQYSVSGGGIIRGSSLYDDNKLIPEFQAKARITPFRQVSLEMFSYSQLRNPMQIAQDSLQHHEQVSGVQFSTGLPGNGRFLVAYGLRKSSRDTNEVDHQFMKLQLEQKLLGLQFRIRGEKDLYSYNFTSGDNDRSNMSIQWYGSPIRGLNWSALNSVHYYDGEAYWRIYQRANYQVTNRSTVWAHVKNEQVAYRGSYLNTQAFDFDYRWKLNDMFAFQTLIEGSKVKPLSGDPMYHWRSYLGGVHWRVGERTSALGVLQFGYKESYRFGSGNNVKFELEERLPLLESRLLRIAVRDYAAGEYFTRSDDVEEDPRYDIDHNLDLTLDLWPGQKIQLGNTFRLINHWGTDLDFSEDTLRNAVTHNVQLKYIQRKFRASLDHLTINDLGDSSDTRLHLNTRFTYRMTNRSSLNLVSMYRYQSEMYPDYVWLSSFLKLNMPYFDWAVEVQAQGSPDTLFEENFSVWMRFMRQL